MINKNKALLGIIACVFFSIATIQHTQAATKIFDETYTTNDPYIAIEYRVVVWSDQHVEIYSSYYHHSSNPDMCTFWYLGTRVGGRMGSNYYNIDIDEHAPAVWKTAYVDGYGNLNQGMWESGTCVLMIDVQMKVTSYEYTTRWAIFRLAMINSNGQGIALIADLYILIRAAPIMPDC